MSPSGLKRLIVSGPYHFEFWVMNLRILDAGACVIFPSSLARHLSDPVSRPLFTRVLYTSHRLSSGVLPFPFFVQQNWIQQCWMIENPLVQHDWTYHLEGLCNPYSTTAVSPLSCLLLLHQYRTTLSLNYCANVASLSYKKYDM